MTVAVPTARGAPTGERGSIRPDLAGLVLAGMPGIPGWAQLPPSDFENVPALWWPQSIRTYHYMARDAQVVALKHAIGLPVQRYRISVDPNGMDAAMSQLLADDLDLPLGDQEVSSGRRLDRFSHRLHFARAISALDFGHAVFEQVGYIDADGWWRLEDLAPRPAWTIDAWYVDRAGRLEAVEQQHTYPVLRLEAERLVVYTWQGEPGDPRGESMLRPLYKSWVAKDRGIRIDMVTHERNGMGVPVGWLAEDASPADRDALEALLAAWAAGEESNLVLPHGSDVRLVGVSGRTSDVVTSLRFHNEEMARALLAMVLQLAQTSSGSGSRGLGGTFEELLRMYHDTVVQWYCDTLTRLAEQWVTRNLGADAPAARIVWERDEHEPPLTGIPGDQSGGAQPGAPAGTAPATSASRRAKPRQLAAAASLPDRELRRAPTDVETRAGVDFAAVESQWQTVADAVVAALTAIRDALIAAAVDFIHGLANVDPITLADQLAEHLASHADEIDTTDFTDALEQAAANGVDQVIGEAREQGHTASPDAFDYADRAQAEARAQVDKLVRAVADSAGNAASVSTPAGTPGPTAATGIRTQLDELTTAGPELSASGATSRAQTAGREHGLGSAPFQKVYASALLDTNTCGPCIEWDGHEFDDLGSARDQFPLVGNKDCEGRERCRCLLVGVLDTEQEVAT